MDKTNGKDVDWNDAQLDYELRGVPVRQIALKHDISERALYKRIREEGWIARRPSRQSDGASTAERLRLLVRRELKSLEQNIVEGAVPGNRGVLLTVQTIAKTLERIFELEKREHVSKRRKPKPRLIDDARCEELARRFEGLSRQIELERHSPPAQPR
jgi:hypothetical protein